MRKASEGEVETLVYNNTGPFQSANGLVFSVTQDTLFMPNRYVASDVKNDVSVMFCTREANFINVKALISIPRLIFCDNSAE